MQEYPLRHLKANRFPHPHQKQNDQAYVCCRREHVYTALGDLEDEGPVQNDISREAMPTHSCVAERDVSP